jgi:transposase
MGTPPTYHPGIFHSRYLQLRRADRLEPEARARLEQVLSLHPDLAHALAFYQHLHRIYLAEDEVEADRALGEFIAVHSDRPLPEFDKVIGVLLNWGGEIFAFHQTGRASNGRLEGTNNKRGVLKPIAYGFTNADNFGARALLLTPAVPS